MGHLQGTTPIYVNKSTTFGITNNTIKRQRSRATNMRYFRIFEQVEAKQFKVLWEPGLENLADCFTKHHLDQHHRKVRPFYVHEYNSTDVLMKAPAPRYLQGCVNPDKPSYNPRLPLPTVGATSTRIGPDQRLWGRAPTVNTMVTTDATWLSRLPMMSSAQQWPVHRCTLGELNSSWWQKYIREG